MNTSTRPHVQKVLDYERRRAQVLKTADGILNIAIGLLLAIIGYAVLVGLAA